MTIFFVAACPHRVSENHTNAIAAHADTQTKAMASVWLALCKRGTEHNKMFTQWRVKFKFLVLCFKQRSVVADSLAFQIPPLRKHKR